jgi:small subunit ribosomal protein S3
LEEKFKVANPQISVSEIEIPELNAYVVASRVASALQRGVHFRRAGFWSLNQVMEAGALGAEIVISGKLRTERARYEKFRAGYLVKCGEPSLKYMQKAEVHVQLKPGMFGVRVRIMPPDAIFPDKIKIVENLPPPEEKTAEEKTAEEKAEQEPKAEEEKSEEASSEAEEEKTERANSEGKEEEQQDEEAQ